MRKPVPAFAGVVKYRQKEELEPIFGISDQGSTPDYHSGEHRAR